MNWLKVLMIISTLNCFMFWRYSKINFNIRALSKKLDANLMDINARLDQQINLRKEGKK